MSVMPPAGSPFSITIVGIDAFAPDLSCEAVVSLELSLPPFLRTTSRTMATITTPTPSTTRIVEFMEAPLLERREPCAVDPWPGGHGSGYGASGGGRRAIPKAIRRPPPGAKEFGGRGRRQLPEEDVRRRRGAAIRSESRTM